MFNVDDVRLGLWGAWLNPRLCSIDEFLEFAHIEEVLLKANTFLIFISASTWQRRLRYTHIHNPLASKCWAQLFRQHIYI